MVSLGESEGRAVRPYLVNCKTYHVKFSCPESQASSKNNTKLSEKKQDFLLLSYFETFSHTLCQKRLLYCSEYQVKKRTIMGAFHSLPRPSRTVSLQLSWSRTSYASAFYSRSEWHAIQTRLSRQMPYSTVISRQNVGILIFFLWPADVLLKELFCKCQKQFESHQQLENNSVQGMQN